MFSSGAVSNEGRIVGPGEGTGNMGGAKLWRYFIHIQLSYLSPKKPGKAGLLRKP